MHIRYIVFATKLALKWGYKGNLKGIFVSAIHLRPRECEKHEKRKKEKKMFATFPFKGCKPSRYHMKIAYIRIRVTVPPKHQSK